MLSLYALLIGFMLDLIIGDPIGWPHVVLGYGKLIVFFEKRLRRILPATPRGMLSGGIVLVVLMCVISLGVGIGILYACQRVSPYLRLGVESVFVWQCLSLRSLRVAGLTVFEPLKRGDLPSARLAVAEIVGRDTQNLDEPGVARATVETVAENTSDGIIAPLVFMALGGAPLGLLYKAINTMDSLVGYKNDQYLYFGRAAARLDDVFGFIPARLGGLLMAVSAPLAGFDGKNAFRIFRRDRLNHKSPNSAHAEAACAGALHIQLGGDNYYFGKLVPKPTIGDNDRPVETEDIRRASRLMYVTAFVCVLLSVIIKGVIVWL